MKKISLNGEWSVTGFSPEGETMTLPATVPGCIHKDLANAGVIGDIFWRFNGEDVQWIDKWNWRYEREFTVSEISKDSFIEFSGLDVYCEVYLNDIRIGRGDDMFISYHFPVGDKLKIGVNKLTVVFFSPTLYTIPMPCREGAFTLERLYTRRMQCTYYWDWSNRFITCGIYRDVNLCTPSCTEIESVYIYTENIDKFSAQIGYEVEFDYKECIKGEVVILSPNGNEIYKRNFLVNNRHIEDFVDIENPELWHTADMGMQPLYTFLVRLANGVETREKFGIRTVKILQLPDKPGSEYYEKCMELKKGPHVSGNNEFWDRNTEFSGFILVINGEPIMCKGANWVPCEPFPSEESPEKIRELLILAKEAGVNMLRVWGGGIVEQEFFYSECDRLGICVTQDFLMACGNYPEEDEEFLDKLRLEAREATLALRNHPCMVWWTGDNENAMDADESMDDYKGMKSAHRAIGPVLKELDPKRRFLPSSPYRGTPYGSITVGTAHNSNYIGELYQYIRYEDFYNYTSYFEMYLSRFCVEQPTMGVPQTTSLRKFLNEEDIYGDDEAVWRYHTKNNPSEIFKEFEIYDYLKAIAEKLFGNYKNGADKLFKMQYVQYEWVRLYMELYRRNKWFSSGMIYWMWNDIWPASGWSLVDYYALPKAAYYSFKKAAKSVTVSIGETENSYEVYVCNDALSKKEGTGRLWVQPLCGGEVEQDIPFEFVVEGNKSTAVLRVEKSEISLDDTGLLMCEIKNNNDYDRSFRFDKRPQDKLFPKTKVEIISKGENSITLRSENYTHAVMLDGEYVFSDNCFTMLPKEEKTVTFRNAFGELGGGITVSWLGMEE